MLSRLRARWTGRPAQAGVYVGVPVAAVAVMLAVGAGLPVLGHATQWLWLAGGLVAAALAAGATSRGWGFVGGRGKVAVAALAGLLTVAFTVGVASGPVMVDHKVYLSTSRTAKAAKLADQMRTDLFALVAYDDLLGASQEDARANVARYAPAQRELLSMSAHYAQVRTSDLPDPRFSAVAEQIQSAAYWGSKAMQAKASLIEQDDAKTSADLDSWRATYAQASLSAGDQLASLTQDLGIPFELRQEGPHE